MSFGLPIDDVLGQVADDLAQQPNVVLVAPPGSGKTTVVPLHLTAQPWCTGKILMLEPRRLATRAAAQRMAATLGEPIGKQMGYRMRGDSRAGARIEVITEGVLTRMLHSDPTLDGVSVVIFDEFHERNLHGDVGLALTLDVQGQLRPDLRVVVMSATIDSAAVAGVLGTPARPVPVVEGAGRTFPVSIMYSPPGKPSEPWHVSLARCIQAAVRDNPHGDVLVFCPGSPEIHRVARQINLPTNVDVHHLFGTQDRRAQDAALSPAALGRRNVILATAVAETSLTLPNIRVVIDGGLSRVGSFDQRRGMNRLDTVRVTQASADQRAGRAGRTAPGVCYRMWPSGDRLVAAPEPEIAHADLTGLAIDLARWGTPASGLRWLTPPPSMALEAAHELLRELDALDNTGQLTSHGEALSEMPMHPRLAHMLVVATELGLSAIAQQIIDVLDSRSTDTAALPRHASTGICLALAYPERVAKIRDGSSHRYLLRNGTGAELGPDADHRGATYLAIADAAVHNGVSRIFECAPISLTDLTAIAGTQFATNGVVAWDRAIGDIRAQRVTTLGAITIASEPIERADCTNALLDGVRAEGLSLLPLGEAAQEWRHRVQFLHDTIGEPYPTVDDEAVIERLDEWLAPALAGVRSRRQLQHVDTLSALKSLLDWSTNAAIDRLAPTSITVPSGSSQMIDYASGRPQVHVKLQEMFGLAATPLVAAGRVPITLHLLSPARRPIAVTADLASFWAGPYQEIRKELRGRYPRHPWPDDPLTAPATARLKPRR